MLKTFAKAMVLVLGLWATLATQVFAQEKSKKESEISVRIFFINCCKITSDIYRRKSLSDRSAPIF